MGRVEGGFEKGEGGAARRPCSGCTSARSRPTDDLNQSRERARGSGPLSGSVGPGIQERLSVKVRESGMPDVEGVIRPVLMERATRSISGRWVWISTQSIASENNASMWVKEQLGSGR